ncbi:hypothetical protein AB1N83_009410 [Pleurotus pulmonarius]
MLISCLLFCSEFLGSDSFVTAMLPTPLSSISLLSPPGLFGSSHLYHYFLYLCIPLRCHSAEERSSVEIDYINALHFSTPRAESMTTTSGRSRLLDHITS